MDGIEHGLNWSLGLYKEPEIKSVDDFEPGLIKLTKMDTDSEQVQKSIQLSTERDMYKKLYEDLLAQVIK